MNHVEIAVIIAFVVVVIFLTAREFFSALISTEWHDHMPLFPVRVDGTYTRKNIQRRQWGSGSSSETANSWIEYRIKP